jgi:hypothetical protein
MSYVQTTPTHAPNRRAPERLAQRGALVIACLVLALTSASACNRGGESGAGGAGGGGGGGEGGGARATSGLEGGRLVFADDFERESLGENWTAQGQAWSIRDGQVFVADARNDALWLQYELPEEVRVELEATAESPEGDLKFEIFGDGRTHESGYVMIYGGWRNSTTCIARLDEHGEDRLDAAQHVPVEVGRPYRMAVVRTDARVRWYIDGALVLSFDDAEPLRGPEHAHFAFNDWAAPVRFDNVRVYDLSE